MKFICDVKGHEATRIKSSNPYNSVYYCKHCGKRANVYAEAKNIGCIFVWD